MKFTHKEYMNKACTHREYHGQFVTPRIKSYVLRKFGIDRLTQSTDPHLNDIPLREWGILNFRADLFKKADLKAAGEHYSIAFEVCVLKEAARQLIEEAKKETVQ
jgi:hypothetical protein